MFYFSRLLLGSCLLAILEASSCFAQPGNENQIQDPPLYYPRKIKVPEELPSYEIVVVPFSGKIGPGRQKLIFPISSYVEGHFDGWKYCLEDFLRFHQGEPRDLKDPLLQASLETGYSVKGHGDGFRACRDALIALREKHELEEVRRLAQEALDKFPKRNENEE